MVSPQRVKTSGFAELDAALADLGKSTGRNVLKRTAMTVMKGLELTMADLAPKEEGTLSESMRTQPIKAKRQRGQRNFSPKTAYETITGPAPEGKMDRANAGFQEFGTVNMTPNSYARPAADIEIDGIVEHIKETLAQEIGKAQKRAARKAQRIASLG